MVGGEWRRHHCGCSPADMGRRSYQPCGFDVQKNIESRVRIAMGKHGIGKSGDLRDEALTNPSWIQESREAWLKTFPTRSPSYSTTGGYLPLIKKKREQS